MKIFIPVLLLLSNFAFGLEVILANYNENQDILEVHVEYVGGCVEHQFEMQIVSCILSKTENIGLINICDARINDVTKEQDRCESVVRKTLMIPLHGLKAHKRPDLLGFNHTNVVLVSKKS